MAELLVRASKHWMDDLKQTDINKMSGGEKEAYDARTQIGDIIVVKPDGWVWGKEECLPTFLIVKLPGISVDTVEHFTQPLMGLEGKILKRRKFRVPETSTTNYTQLGNSVVTINISAQITTFINAVVEKTS